MLALALFETAFFFAYRYGMAFSQTTSSPFWFPDSVLLCALLLTRPRHWWLFVLAPLPLRLTVAVPDAPTWFLLATFAVDSAKGLAVAVALRRVMANPIRIGTLKELALYCAFAVVLVPAAAAFGGAAVRSALGFDYRSAWEQWFLGNALAHLVVTPLLFYWVLRPEWLPSITRFSKRSVEGGLMVSGLIVSAFLAFEVDPGAGFSDARVYAPVPFLFWAALRFGMPGATGAMGVLTLFAVAAALRGRGLFAGATPGEVAVALQNYLVLRAVPLLIVAVLSEHKRAIEQSLRDREQSLRHVTDNALVMIWLGSLDKQCEFVNAGWLAFRGRSLDQERGAGWAEGLHPDDRAACIAEYSACFDARRPFHHECRILASGGDYRWIVTEGVPRYSASGEFLGYVGSAMDITERRRQEAALRDSEERYREVVESQTDLVCRHLPDTTLTFVNEAFCRCFRQPREQLIGRKFPDLLPRRAHDDVRRLLSVVAQHRVPHGGEHELTTGAGVSAWHHWVHHAIVGPGGELEEFQSIGHDITDRKRAEEAQRDLAHSSRLAVVGQLTAVIAHEVTQPLAAIMSNADAATRLLDANRLDTQEFRDILVDIRDSDRRADEAIRRIRALLSKREMQRQPVDVNATAADVVHLVAGDALRRRVHVRTSFAPELPAVSADRVHLQQVLLNLIVNAMDAMEETPEAAREVTVVTKSHARGGVEVEVRDRGCGIPDEQLRHVFDSFFTTKKEGMGMGLSIARSIVEAHGGKIWAEPVEGGGTTFRFVIGSADA